MVRRLGQKGIKRQRAVAKRIFFKINEKIDHDHYDERQVGRHRSRATSH